MGSFREILPDSHPSVGRASEIVNHPTVIVCQQLDYWRIFVWGEETGKQRRIGSNRMAFGARENRRWEGAEGKAELRGRERALSGRSVELERAGI